jgi:hypothetical protein
LVLGAGQQLQVGGQRQVVRREGQVRQPVGADLVAGGNLQDSLNLGQKL